MQGAAATEESLRKKMESLKLICEKEVPVELQKMDSFAASFAQSLDSVKSRVEDTLRNQEKLGKMKSSLREAEDDFVKVLAVKTRKEAKQMAIRESISATRARVEELKSNVQVQRARRDEYAAVISHQSHNKENQEIDCKGEIQEAISWYNKVLGFHIEGGRGVKFTFNNINTRSPYEEFTFTVRHENDTYTLLDCDPHLNATEELIHELNKTNGLFKFVRTMREKFLEVALIGTLSQSTSLHQESALISVSAPASSLSTERSESPGRETEYSHEVKRQSKKVNLGKGPKKAILLSPQSAVRRSPRFAKVSTAKKR